MPEDKNKKVMNPDYKKQYSKTLKLIDGLRRGYPQYKDYSDEDWVNMFEQIALVESGNKNIRQKSKNGFGPARGYFQMEPESAITARNRYNNIQKDLKSKGIDIGEAPLFDEDFTKLDKDAQAAYVLTNMAGTAGKKRELGEKNLFVSPKDVKTTWLKTHWNGNPAQLEDRTKHFEEVAKEYNFDSYLGIDQMKENTKTKGTGITTNIPNPLMPGTYFSTGKAIPIFKQGGVVKMDNGGVQKTTTPEPDSRKTSTKILNHLLRATPLPKNATQLVSAYATGDPVPPNVNDMTENERIVLYQALNNARQRTGQNSGGTEYIDYGKDMDTDLEHLKGNPLSIGAASFLSPEFVQATTLGRVSYKYDPKTGTYSISDAYNFAKTPNKDSAYSKFRNAVGTAVEGTELQSDKSSYNVGTLSDKDYKGKKAGGVSYSTIKKNTDPIVETFNKYATPAINMAKKNIKIASKEVKKAVKSASNSSSLYPLIQGAKTIYNKVDDYIPSFEDGGLIKMDFGGETQFNFNNQDLINSRAETSKTFAIEAEKRRIKDRDTSGSFGERALRGAKDFGMYTADMTLSPINQDIIKDKYYSQSKFGQGAKEVGHVAGPILNKAAPIVANYFVPGSGQLVTAAQQASNSFVEQDEDRMKTDTGRVMNELDPFLGAASSAIGSSMGSTTTPEGIPAKKKGGYAMQRYEDGGMPTALINIEGSGIAEGSPTQMRKGELLVSDGKILDNYIKNSPHPSNPDMIDPLSTKTVSPTSTGKNPVVIPKKNSTEYSTTNIAERKRIELSLLSKQMERNRKENVSKIMDFKKKYGGKVIPRFDPGGDTMTFMPSLGSNNKIQNLSPQYGPDKSVNANYDDFDLGNVAPQPDMTSWLGNLGNYGTQVDTTPAESMITSDSWKGNYKTPIMAPSGGGKDPMPGDLSKYAGIGSKALSLLSPLMKIKDGMGKPDVLKRSDYTVAPNLKPSLIDDYATQQMINDAANVGLYSLRRSNRGPAAQINLGVNAMKQKWASKQEIQKANAASIMDTNKANKQIEQGNMQGYFEVENRNAANAAAGRNLRREGVNDLSKAANQDIYDKSFWDTIPMVADNPRFNAWLKTRQSNNKTNK